MKILFDHQIFSDQNHGGISRYFFNLIKELKKDPDLETFLPICDHQNEYLKGDLEIHSKIEKERKLSELFKKNKNYNQKASIKYIQEGKFDIFHATYYSEYFTPFIGDKPYVITIHDMIYEIFPEMFSLKDKLAIQKKELSKKASGIIAVSQKTKEDLVKFLGIDEQKVAVIYQACSLDQSQIKKIEPFSNSKKYLFYVGNRAGYKNFYFMIYSLAETLLENPELEIICFGKEFDKKEINFIRSLGLEKKIRCMSGDDDLLISLYKGALTFISPSYYEGFGVTILESFACGCPVLAADSSVTPETAGKAAYYFDPKDPTSIKKAVNKICQNGSLRSELIDLGYDQNNKFSWAKTANEMKNFYKSIL